MKTIAVRFKMKHVVLCFLWILSLDTAHSTTSKVISNTSNTVFHTPVTSQMGVTTIAAAKNITNSISSVFSYSNIAVNMTSPSAMDQVSTSSSLADSFVKGTTSTPGLENTVPRMTSTADSSTPNTLTQTMTSAPASESTTSVTSSVGTTKPTLAVTSINESHITDTPTTTATTPQSVTSESENVTPVTSNTTHEVTSVTPVTSNTTHEITSVTPVMSRTVTNTTHKLTSVVSTSTATKTTASTPNVTLGSEKQSVTPVVSNETTGGVTSTASKFSVTSSFTSTFVTSSQGATETFNRFTVSSNTSVINVPSVTVTTSATAPLPVTSTLFPNKSVTTSYSVREATYSPSVAKTTITTSSVVIATSVTYSSTVATSTQPPTTSPSTTTTPTKPPKFLEIPPKDKTVEEGQTLELTCKATGFPPPIIIWRKGTARNTLVLQNTSRIFISLDNSTLKIIKTTKHDEGTYVCNASNKVGRGEQAEAHIKITYFSDLKISITEPADERSIKEGDKVILSCSVHAKPLPYLEWMKDGKNYNSGSTQSLAKNSRYVADLDIWKISRENGGNYTCLARNRTGRNLLGVTYKMLYVKISPTNLPTYPPPKAMEKTDHTITIPVHKITYLGNGKKVSYIQVIVYKLKDQTLPEREPENIKPSELGPYSRNRTELYIAAVILLEDVIDQSPAELVLGDGSKSSASTRARKRRNPRNDDKMYSNVPLDPDTYYTAFQRMMSIDEDHESLDWIPATKTTAPSQLVSDSNLSTILWSVCASLVVFIVIIVLIAIYIIQRNKSQNHDIDDTATHSGNAFSKMTRSLSMHMARLHEHYHPYGPIPIENFAHHVTRMHKSGDMHFSTEYEKIPEHNDIPATHSIDPANQWKNRYSNIVAYDYNRVKLVPFDDEPASDYINASYITGYNKEKTYIAAQGPLDETCGDFWRMIWEQNTRVIVMLTNVRERGRLKCSQYWPTSGKSRYEVIYVSLEEVVELTPYAIRVFRVAMAGQKETRIIKQFHFTGWPDHGAPKSATFLLAFIRHTAKVNPPDAGPMVVHCSAGVGRTGTFIVIDQMLEQIAKEKTVDIQNYVTQLRKQRNLMVQTEQQYIFIHDALLDVIISGETEIHASKLREHVQEMIEPYKETGDSKMTFEFQRLSRGVRPHYTFTAATIPANKSKNRYANTLPYDDTRVPLVVQEAVNGSDYVNANYIDAYMKKRAFIATQAPLPETFDDFWRMIWEQKCYTIVVLAQEMENTKLKMNRYWPTTHPITFGALQVEMLEEDKKEFLETRVFNITNTMDSSSQIVHQFHYTAWTSEDLSESGINLLSMIEQIQQWQDASGNHVITVHCSAGVGRTGVFCAVSSLIERLKAEAAVDVFQTVKQLREQRPAMVQTKSQYEFCYRVLLEYLDTHTSLEESYDTGNPPRSEEESNEISGQNSPKSEHGNRKSDLIESASTTDALSEAKQENAPETAIKNLEPEDVTPKDKAQVNVTPQDDGVESASLEVTLENGVSQQDATLEIVTLKNNSAENITANNKTLEDEITLENTANESVTQPKVIQDVTPETQDQIDEEPLANNFIENSPPILQRADSEESDPYVSPLSSSLNVIGS